MAVEESFTASLTVGGNYLKHHGVKGMKWGQIRARVRGGFSKDNLIKAKEFAVSEDHIKSQVISSKAKFVGARSLSNKELSTVIKRMDLEVKFSELKKAKHSQSMVGQGARWVGKHFTHVLVTSAISWLQRPGSRAAAGSGVTLVVGGAKKDTGSTKVKDLSNVT